MSPCFVSRPDFSPERNVFRIRLGIPEVQRFWDELNDRTSRCTLSKDEQRLFTKWGKAMSLLEANPRHPGLNSHDIPPLTRRYGKKVWQSYLENRTPAAGRIFWVYGPDQGDITIIGIEPHPEDKKSSGYSRSRLTSLLTRDGHFNNARRSPDTRVIMWL